MKSKLVFTVLILVILPTAVLSVMAARTLKHWEVILGRRLSRSAVGAVETLRQRVEVRLGDGLDEVHAAMSAGLARGGKADDIREAAASVTGSQRLIGEVFLFMNPWGFVHPAAGTDEERALGGRQGDDPLAISPRARVGEGRGEPGTRPDLMAALRRGIATATMLTRPVKFSSGGAAYCFSMLEESKVLYAGYRVDIQEFTARLSEDVAALSGSGIRLVAEGPGVRIPATGRADKHDVTISDPFAPDETYPPEAEGDGAAERPLAVGELPSPLDAVRIRAFAEDPGRTRRAGRLEARLYGWGILLMAAGIVAGAWAVLREAASEIRQARARSDFVVGVSHDLRTPISSMKMLAESLFLDHVQDPQQKKRFLSTMVSECERLSQLVERVLFFVRFGQDALVYSLHESDLGALVESVVGSFVNRFSGATARQDNGEGDRRPEAEPGAALEGSPAACGVARKFAASGLAVTLTKEPGLPRAKVDEGAVSQVILNLLDNAVKYSCRGRAVVRVEVAGTVRKRHAFGRQREWLRIAVGDKGIGIRRNELRRIFRKFYRGRGAKREHVSGVGLGLAMCRHVATAHGGWIEAESVPGEGSTFTVFLPAAADVADPNSGEV